MAKPSAAIGRIASASTTLTASTFSPALVSSSLLTKPAPIISDASSFLAIPEGFPSHLS